MYWSCKMIFSEINSNSFFAFTALWEWMADSPTPYKVALVVREATVGSYDQSCKDKMKSLVRILNIEVKVKSPCEISSCETML